MKKLIFAMFAIVSCANQAAVFQKISDEAEITDSDVVSCQEVKNEDGMSLRVNFSEQASQKIVKVFDQANTKVNLVVNGTVIETVAVPRPIKKIPYFTINTDNIAQLKADLGCK